MGIEDMYMGFCEKCKEIIEAPGMEVQYEDDDGNTTEDIGIDCPKCNEEIIPFTGRCMKCKKQVPIFKCELKVSANGRTRASGIHEDCGTGVNCFLTKVMQESINE